MRAKNVNLLEDASVKYERTQEKDSERERKMRVKNRNGSGVYS